ncbi:D-xylose-proton symporter-like 3, chloroplastic isoform X2 [Miscanthus floridulus]|uniref:D-xylose-proton symporter-like 3, chloroplastic isoform X2 n=1 Tax=Miscanthus floridulus TaxID=154761 RepID=UPI0034594863
MATLGGLFPSSVAASTAIRAPAPAAPTGASNRQSPHARRFPVLGRRVPAMAALRVSGAAEPLLRPAAGGHPRLRVRTHAQGEGGAGRGASTEGDAAFSWAPIILPFFFPALGGLLFGYDIGATSGATISVQSPDLSGTDWFSLSSLQLGLVASSSLYGALGGSLLAYRIADFLGRRIELVTAAALYILGALVTGFAPNFVALIIGRVLYGIGIGLAMHGAPLYIAETSPSQIRGTLISLKELFIVLGILLGYSVGSLEIDNVGGWRYMFGFSAPLAAIMAIGMWTLPSSPRWLLLRAVQGKASMEDNKKKAIQALRTLRGRSTSEKVLTDDVEDTIVSIKAAYAGQEAEGNVWEVFEGASLKAFTIGGGLVLFQQITGQPSVLYYAASILQLLMTGVAVFKVDDVGRRPLLIGGVGGIALSLFLLAAYYKILNGFPFVAVGALLLYVGAYQVSFGPISWLMVSEIFPLRTRGRGISLAVLTNFGSNALVTFAFSPLKEFLGPANIFFLFGVIAVLSLVFVILVVPETKGLSLEEIESKILK